MPVGLEERGCRCGAVHRLSESAGRGVVRHIGSAGSHLMPAFALALTVRVVPALQSNPRVREFNTCKERKLR